MKLRYRYLSAVIFLLLAGPPCLAAKEVQRIRPADTLPKTTPWDLEALSAPPAFKWSEGDDKGVRSLYYSGDAYKGKPTRVFAHYATPGTLARDPSK
ncbi:MAG: hypothetical protein WBF17_28000, partial [Phycisphaerae bacterium]